MGRADREGRPDGRSRQRTPGHRASGARFASSEQCRLRASQEGVEAFTRLVDEHSDLVQGVTVRILGDEDARDAAQEVWIKAWAGIKGFRGDSASSIWLYRIVVTGQPHPSGAEPAGRVRGRGRSGSPDVGRPYETNSQ